MKILSVKVNNRKKTLEIDTKKGHFVLPFSKLRLIPSAENRIVSVFIDEELGREAITYTVQSGEHDTVHLDAFLEYNRDPDFFRKLLLYKLTLKAIQVVEVSQLSIREIARKLNTSPAQLYRLLDPANYSKTIDQMVKLLTCLNCDLSSLVDQINNNSNDACNDSPGNQPMVSPNGADKIDLLDNKHNENDNSTTSKQLSNPASTGGLGPHFENRVQASFVVLMLAGGFAPSLRPWPIQKIKLQGKYQNFDTDDLIVYTKQPGNNRHAKLLGQIKHSISITKSDQEFSRVIRDAWNDFNNQDIFSEGTDIIALITGPLSATDTQDGRTLLRQAKHSEDAEDFIKRIELANFTSNQQRTKLDTIKFHLKTANNNIDLTNDQLWRFLKSFHLLIYDLDIEGVILSLLHSLIGQYSQDNVSALWTQIESKVALESENAGYITSDSFANNIRSAFQRKVTAAIPNDLIQSPLAAAKVDWKHHTYASELAIANLLGSWDEKTVSDTAIITQLTNEEYSTWISKIREILQQPESPITLKNGVWTVIDRKQLWQAVGARLFDDNLDLFKRCVVDVLKERDPQFDLLPEDRYAASIHGKMPKHSNYLRKGLAESLALLGNFSDALTHCSLDKPETIAVLAVREIFEDTDWKLWGSLNDLLILLAEAAPNEFLSAVEVALRRTPCPFDELFSQEGNGITGRNYLTGLLWALETLAWDEQYLVHVSVILSELASRDTGGNWANRPSNSLTTIFLPWLPQTMASIEKRKVAIQTLQKEVPDIGWKLLLSLLPNQHQTSWGSHKPKWRNTIPENWLQEVPQKEYWDQVLFYADTAVDMAGSDIGKLCELVDHLDNLPQPSFEKLLAHLTSEVVIGKPEDERLDLWSGLITFASKHRRFPDAKWAMSSEMLKRIEEIAKTMAPRNPLNLHRRLFSNRDFELCEEIGNWEEQLHQLEERRQQAIKEILNFGGIDGVLEFAKTVKSSFNVGNSLGFIAESAIDSTILPGLLETKSNDLRQLARGYIWGRHNSQGWTWTDNLDLTGWSNSQVGEFLACLPFTSETWTRTNKLLKNSDEEYWVRAVVNPYQSDCDLKIAIDKLLKHGRPKAAINCLNKILIDKQPLDKARTAKVLLAAVSSNEPSYAMDSFHIVEIIKALQNAPDTDQDDLFRIEWAYLSLLDRQHNGSPKVLENRLASDPAFFCEVIRLIYRSKNELDSDNEATEDQKAIARNAYRLLDKWRVPPGLQSNGIFSQDQFRKWLEFTKAKCAESGHLEVALTHVGYVLVNCPPDAGGLWIDRVAAEALNAKDAEKMRNGFRLKIYNSRGGHWVDPTGKPERDLADKYRQRAEDVENAGYLRLALTLRDLAKSYDREAERIISEHKQEGKGD